MSKRRKIISGIGIDVFGTIISMIVGLAVVPIYFSYISNIQYGIWLAINGLVAMLSILDFGTDQYLMTVVSNDQKFKSNQINKYISTNINIKLVVSIILSLVSAIIYLFISNILKIDEKFLEEAKEAYLWAFVSIILILFNGTISTILYGRHHISLVNGLSTVAGLLTSFLTIFFLNLGLNLTSFPLAIFSAVGIQITFLSIYLIKKYPHIKLIQLKFTFHDKSEIFRYTLSFQVLRWVYMLRTQFIVIAINNFVGPAATTSYSITNRLPQIIPLVSSKLALPFLPSFSEYFSTKDLYRAGNIFISLNKILFRFALFSSVVCFVITKSFVSLWVGVDSFAGPGTLFFLCLYVFIIAAMGSFGLVIYSSKNFERWPMISALEILFTVIFSYWLSVELGLMGVIIGFAFASLISQIYLFKIVLEQLNITILKFYKSVIIYSLVANIPTIIIAFIIYIAIKIDSWSDIFVACSAFLVTNIICCEGYLMLKSSERDLKSKFLSLFKL